MKASGLLSAEEMKHLNDKERHQLEIERSKYLGGDLEHTHLVRGLDYALLAKVKAQIAREEKEKELEAKKKAEMEEKQKTSATAGFSQLISSHGKTHTVEEPTEFQTFVGRGIFEAIFKRHQYAFQGIQFFSTNCISEPTVEHFLPGRTTFVYDMAEESLSDIPTVVKRCETIAFVIFC